MSITRRKFLKAGSLVALAAAIPLRAMGQQISKGSDGNPFDQTKDSYPDQLAHYTRSAFSSYLNSVFLIYTGYNTIEVTLVEVKDLVPAAAKTQAGAECFSLLFRGERSAMRQNTYRIEHPSLGTFALFLVPGGVGENAGQNYIAIVNRIAGSPALFASPARSVTTPPAGPDQKVSQPVRATPAAPVTPLKKNRLKGN